MPGPHLPPPKDRSRSSERSSDLLKVTQPSTSRTLRSNSAIVCKFSKSPCPRGFLPPRGHLAMRGDIFGCHAAGGGEYYWHLMGWGQACCSTSYNHRTDPHIKETSIPQPQISTVPRLRTLVWMFLISLATSPPLSLTKKTRDGTSEAQVSREQIFYYKHLSLLDSYPSYSVILNYSTFSKKPEVIKFSSWDSFPDIWLKGWVLSITLSSCSIISLEQ